MTTLSRYQQRHTASIWTDDSCKFFERSDLLQAFVRFEVFSFDVLQISGHCEKVVGLCDEFRSNLHTMQQQQFKTIKNIHKIQSAPFQREKMALCCVLPQFLASNCEIWNRSKSVTVVSIGKRIICVVCRI